METRILLHEHVLNQHDLHWSQELYEKDGDYFGQQQQQLSSEQQQQSKKSQSPKEQQQQPTLKQ